MAKRPSKVERRRSILAAARKVFARRGYAATRVSDIAEAAKVGKGTLYSHFQGKDDLFATLVIVTMRESLETLTQTTSTAEPERAMRDLIAFVVEVALVENRDLYRLFYDFWGVSAAHRGHAQKRLREVAAGFRQLVAETVLRGQQSGRFSSDVEPEQVARALAAFVDGLSLQLVILGDRIDLAAYARFLERALLATLLQGGSVQGASILREIQ